MAIVVNIRRYILMFSARIALTKYTRTVGLQFNLDRLAIEHFSYFLKILIGLR